MIARLVAAARAPRCPAAAAAAAAPPPRVVLPPAPYVFLVPRRSPPRRPASASASPRRALLSLLAPPPPPPRPPPPPPPRRLRSSTGSAAAAVAGGRSSSGAAAATESGGGGGGGGGWREYVRWSRVRVFARAVKYLRIPALILGVYGLGYQQGIIDYSRDPALKQDDLLTTILAGVGCVDRDSVKTARDGDWRTKFLGDDEARMRRVALVGEKIVKVAKKYVDEELAKVMARKMRDAPEELREKDEDALFLLLTRDEEFGFWAKAKQRMDGPWRYLLIDTDVANAFVSEILPQRIFVTTAMLDSFVENDDEMALVLGHEVSHLILGHISDSNTLSTMLRTLEILLLSIDPSEGLLSLAFMSFLATVRHTLVAANSRENETAADELGIRLAAMACYDTRRAANVFYKMHVRGTESGADEAARRSSGRSLLSFVDTHPPSNERHLYLVRASEEENAERYEDTHCGSVRKMFRDMLGKVRGERAGGGGSGEGGGAEMGSDEEGRAVAASLG